MSSRDKESQPEDASDLSEEETEPQHVDDDDATMNSGQDDNDHDDEAEEGEHVVETVASKSAKKRKLDAPGSSSPRKKRKTSASTTNSRSSSSPAVGGGTLPIKIAIQNEEETEDERDKEQEQDQKHEEEEDENKNKNKKQSAPKRRRKKTTKSSAEAKQNRLVPSSQTQTQDNPADMDVDAHNGDDGGDGIGRRRQSSRQRNASEKHALHRERLRHCLTQNGEYKKGDDDDDVMLATDEDDDGDEEEDDAKQSEKRQLARERDIENVCDLDDARRIETLHSQTLRRLCRKHDIAIYKHLDKTKKKKTPQKEHKSDASLVAALKDWRAKHEQESSISSLRDIGRKDEIGDLSTKCLRRLGKKHRIAANQKVSELIEQLEDRWAHIDDEDSEDFIYSLRDVHDVEEIARLKRETLLLLCNAHGIDVQKSDSKKKNLKKKAKNSSKKKKKKKTKHKKQEDDDEDEDDDDDEDDDEEEEEDGVMSDEEMIAALQQVKVGMLQRIKQKQNSGLEKLVDYQQGITQSHTTENFLSISGGSNNHAANGSPPARNKNKNNKQSQFDAPMSFKEDAAGLVALCNSIAAHNRQVQSWSITDDAAGPYSVVVSEDGARTVKAMMVVARGGRVVTKRWIEDSIQQQRWVSPQSYEAFQMWSDATKKARDCNPSRPLLHAYSVHVQAREQVGQKPSTEHVVHLLHAAGAHIADREWNTKRIAKVTKPKKQNENGSNKSDDDQEASGGARAKKKKSSSRRSSKKVSEDEDEDVDDDNEEQNKTPKRGAKKQSKQKKKQKKTDKNRMKIIISHPAMYNDLELSEQEKKEVAVVDAKWLFDCIQNYKILDTKQYQVTAKRQSKSPKY